MATEKPELKLQEVQQPMMVEQRQETIGWIGYTQRPLNARTQTRNRYLDWVSARKNFQIIPASTPTKLTWFTYTKTGNYPWDKVDWEFFIAESGTYLLLFTANWDTVTTNPSLLRIMDKDSVVDWISTFDYFNISVILNLNKWNHLYFEIINEDWTSNTLDNIRISLTKLS